MKYSIISFDQRKFLKKNKSIFCFISLSFKLGGGGNIFFPMKTLHLETLKFNLPLSIHINKILAELKSIYQLLQFSHFEDFVISAF